jgi:hypothetical protein
MPLNSTRGAGSAKGFGLQVEHTELVEVVLVVLEDLEHQLNPLQQKEEF